MKIWELILPNFIGGTKEKLIEYIHTDLRLINNIKPKIPLYRLILGITNIDVNSQFNGVSAENMINLIREKRPDLAFILSTPKGKFWLEKNILEVKNYFLQNF